MKFIIRPVLWAIPPILLIICLQGCTALVRNIPNIDDYKRFENTTVKRGGAETALYLQPTALPPADKWNMGPRYKKGNSTEDFFDRTGTVAFLVLRNDTLLSEWYAPEYTSQSTFTTFSLAKSYLSVLTGIAIQEGYIDSVRQPVSAFLPQFNDDSLLSRVTILHLLQMTSGLKSREGYSPWSNATRLYYGHDVMKVVNKVKPDVAPGTKWDYLNLNSQILGLILEKATHRPLSQYLQEKIWIPMGMESDASWSLDHAGGNTKSFCCLNAHARDYARFGLLMLNKGNWKGQQLVPEAWMTESVRCDTAEGSPQRYQYCWYTTAEERDFYGEGLLGQFTYICPETHTVIVRLGHTIHRNTPWYDMFRVIAGIDFKPVAVQVPREKLEPYTGQWFFGLSNWSDSSMYGKTCEIRIKGDRLDVRTSSGQHFKLEAASETLFFDEKSGRRLDFRFDDAGVPEKIRWSRRGNSWGLMREEKFKAMSGS